MRTSKRVTRLLAKASEAAEQRAVVADRAVAYVRVSTEEQAASGYGLEAQERAVRAFAETFSWRSCAEQFVRNLDPYPEPEKTRFWRRLRRLARLRRGPKAA